MPAGAVISAFVVASMLSWVLLVVASRRRTDPSRPQLMAVAFVLGVWTTASLTGAVVDALPYRLGLLRLQLALAVLAPVAWLALASRFDRADRVGRRTLVVLAALATVAATALATVPFGPAGLIQRVTAIEAGNRHLLVVEPGTWFWAATLPFAYLLLGGAALLLAGAWGRSHGAARQQAAALLLAMVPPVVASVLQASGVSPLPAYDLTGLAHGVSALFILVALLGARSLGAQAIAYREVFVAMRDPALVVAPDGHVIDANPAAMRWLAGELNGEALLRVAPQLEVARRAASRRGERRDLTGDMQGFAVSVSHLRGPRGTLTASVLIVHDQRREQEREQRLAAAAHVDGLTGIANRPGFETALGGALAHRGDRAVGVAFIDLDGFKQVNDVHGHAAGDAVLVEVAHRLSQVVRDGDTVARLGGDEFALLLVNVTPLALAAVAERAAEALARPIDVGPLTLRVGASLGLASAPRDGTTVASLVHTSDTRMYRQKQGRHEGRAPRETGHDAVVDL